MTKEMGQFNLLKVWKKIPWWWLIFVYSLIFYVALHICGFIIKQTKNSSTSTQSLLSTSTQVLYVINKHKNPKSIMSTVENFALSYPLFSTYPYCPEWGFIYMCLPTRYISTFYEGHDWDASVLYMLFYVMLCYILSWLTSLEKKNRYSRQNRKTEMKRIETFTTRQGQKKQNGIENTMKKKTTRCSLISVSKKNKN